MFTRPKGRGKTTPLQTDESHRSWRGRVGQRACESSLETSRNDALDAQRGASCADCARAAQWALFTWHPAHARAAYEADLQKALRHAADALCVIATPLAALRTVCVAIRASGCLPAHLIVAC